MTDLERAKRIASRDLHDTESFVREHYPTLFRFMRNLTRNPEDAEDLTQQSLIRACDQIGSYRGEASLRTWLHKVALREYTRWRRARRFFPRLSTNAAYVDSGYESCEDAEMLLQALDQIPPPMREAFLLLEVQELTVAEIATITGVPEGTVKSRLHHARLRLRTLLTQTKPEELKYESAKNEC